MRYLGTDDSVTVCDCCGRKDLKSTVAIETDAGEVVHYGAVCASRALKVGVKVVKEETKAADKAKAEAKEAALKVQREIEFKRWTDFLDKHAPNLVDAWGKSSIIEQIKFLGGFAKARELFKSEVA